MTDKIDFLYVISLRYPCLGTDFELPSHDVQSQFYFLFKIELLLGSYLSWGSSNMNIIKIGDIKILAGTPGRKSTRLTNQT